MTTPKLHHFVPQFHLRRFANADEKICVWDRDRDRTFWTGANSIAAETHFYRLHQYEALGHDGATMEKQLSALEAEASAITDQWLGWLRDADPRTKLQIPHENRAIVAQYMALQYLRTSDTRQMLGAFAESVNGATATTEELRRLHTELLWDEDIVASLTDRFHQTVWLFARNESDGRFITSDNPIAFRTNDNRQWRRAALQGDTYAVYPLAPDIVMYCYPRVTPWGNKLDQFADCLSPVSMTEEMVRSENSGQVFMATRFVFSNRDDFTWEKEFAPTIGTDIYKTEE